MKLKLISIILLIMFVLSITTCDATHYSTANPHQHVIHKSQYHYEDNDGNPPPHRHGTVTEFEIQGLGQHWNEDHKNE